MHVENYTGWDIGGAHLKVARLDRAGALCAVQQFATPLWQGPETLAAPVAQTLEALPDGHCVHAVTMTGELADCFSERREGVLRLTDYLCGRLDRRHSCYVYAGNKGLVTATDVPACHADIASANWHCSATYAAQRLGSGVLVDIGTTTTDIIPFHQRQVCAQGYDDQTRLHTGELVYTGLTRTPVMAVAARVPYSGVWQGVAAEYFANMADVYRITGDLDERFDILPAADGGAKTRYHSCKRLARMLGTDYVKGTTAAPWLELARYLAGQQHETLARAFTGVMNQAPQPVHKRIVAAGAGRFIIEKLAREHGYELLHFEDLLPRVDVKQGVERGAEREAEQRDVNNCATAVAVAALALAMAA
ncbi:MAG: hypothetical protein OXF58_07585 [Gammaproteobacteria bacterium]|nr:hypothetical protein [Gammaproteobacteria bacterium]